jgi:hypothetical protein
VIHDRWGARIFMSSLLILVAVAASPGTARAQFAGRVQGGYGFGDGYGGMVGGSVGIEFPLLFGQPAYGNPPSSASRAGERFWTSPS